MLRHLSHVTGHFSTITQRVIAYSVDCILGVRIPVCLCKGKVQYRYVAMEQGEVMAYTYQSGS